MTSTYGVTVRGGRIALVVGTTRRVSQSGVLFGLVSHAPRCSVSAGLRYALINRRINLGTDECVGPLAGGIDY